MSRRSGCALALVMATCAGAAPPSGFDASRAYEHVRRLVAIGPRPPGSAGIDQARRYIHDELAKIGVKAAGQTFDARTPLGTIRMANVIGTIPGRRGERIIFAGHYDTKLYREFRFVGANDGGSSAAFLIELARALKARANPFTMELLFLDGEEAIVEWRGEDHTYGSRHYVRAAKPSGSLDNVKALILVDMIGDRSLSIRREQRSTAWLTDAIWASARRLKLSDVFLDQSVLIEDDHVPFLEAGIPAVDVIDLEYDAWHTASDTLEQVSARSLQIVGDVLMGALPDIEKRLAKD